MEYQKINTLFKRDSKNIIIPSQYTCEEFNYLKNNLWECTEKVDGTNIRIYVTMEAGEGENSWIYSVTIKGRTKRAQLPSRLVKKLESIFFEVDWAKVFPTLTPVDTVCIYGEGYGAGIQKCGRRYISNDVNFILFDVKFNERWLKRKDCEDIAKKCNINIVPLIGYMTIPQAIEFVKKGFKSKISEDKDLNAEGLVLRTTCGLRFRNGERIITKIKTCDFDKFEAVYGDNPKPQKVEVTVSITLSKTVEVKVKDYTTKEKIDEEGNHGISYDYSECDLKQAVIDQIPLPTDIGQFDDWNEDDFAVNLEDL